MMGHCLLRWLRYGFDSLICKSRFMTFHLSKALERKHFITLAGFWIKFSLQKLLFRHVKPKQKTVSKFRWLIRPDHKPRQAVASMPVLAQESFSLGPKHFLRLISPQNFTYLSDKLRTEFDTLITKSTSPWLSDTTFFASCKLNISDFLTSWTELTKILNVFSGILWSRSAAQRRSRIEKGIECILKRSTAFSHKEGRKAQWIYSNDNKVCLELSLIHIWRCRRAI